MRFIQFLTEIAPQQTDWINKQQKNTRGRQRRANQKRGEMNKQAAQPANVNMQQRPAGTMPTVDFQTGKDIEQQKKPPGGLERRAPSSGPDTMSMPTLPPELTKFAQSGRQQALEMNTLITSMYQTKRVNPNAQMSVPKLVTMSKNREVLQKLFDLAKTKDLGQLAAMSQEIKQSAATTPGTAPGGQQPAQPAAGSQNVPQTPGQTPAGKSVLQKLLNLIKGSTQNLSPADIAVAQKELDKAKQKTKPNPSNGQQPVGKPVMTQG